MMVRKKTTAAKKPKSKDLPTQFSNPDLYINRELSLIEFNRRVLAMALDDDVPLLERLRFLCIANSNLDEFFEIRVAGLLQQVEFGSVQTGPDNLSPADTLKHINERVSQLVDEQYRILNNHLIPQLEKEHVRLLKRAAWKPKLKTWIESYFDRSVLPVLSPIGLDPAHPFPRVSNKNLYFVVRLSGKDAFGRRSGIAVVQAPRSLPRLITVPKEYSRNFNDYIFLSSIIHAHIEELFPGMRVEGCYQFRVTRNSDLFVDDEEVDNLLRALEGELDSRRFGDAVRLEIDSETPEDLVEYLLNQFDLDETALYRVNGPVNLGRISEIYELLDKPELKYPGFTSDIPRRFEQSNSILETLRRGDMLLHHPFQSFVPVVEFVREAAEDPKVLSIKQTLYRTGPESAVVAALLDAARAGKEVTVVIELRARFDEEANIELATKLQQAGAHVVYGVVGYKTHAKMILVVRREGRILRRYVHLGTGNYHARTARLYTDYGLLTCDRDIGEDVNKLFHQLTGLGRAGRLKKLLQSPFTLHKTMIQLIDQEADNAKAGKPAHIMAKMNSLVEPQVIQALYRASNEGVKIELIVRGMCSLKPGVPKASENIQVRSIIGRFLEHTRVFYFFSGGEEKVYLSSADWMQRNFFHRVETCFPIQESRLKQRVIKRGLLTYLNDNTQAWNLQSDGRYKRVRSGSAKRRSSQEALLEAYCK